MCGIAALFSMKSIDRFQIQKMTDVILHRGPDAFGHEYFENDKWQLGHRRLSILDVSKAGKQPMAYSSGQYWITYNGEIYNYIELRQQLEAKGYKFHTNTDTEIIMAAYDCWGKNCLNYFNGMWAFVLLDTVARKAFVARDRFGVKPLYYWYSKEGILAFASEIKQFAVLRCWSASLNHQRAYDFLSWGQSEHTNETMFANVYQIRRGEAVELELDKLDEIVKHFPVHQWYYLKYDKFKGSFREAADEFKKLFIDAVALRLRADVQTGSCLSGGLDSSSVVCVINDLLRQSGKKDIQYTVTSGARIKKYDESEYADAVLCERNIKGYYVYPEFESLFNVLNDITYYQDEPFGSTSIYAQWLVYNKSAHYGLKVMLDGQGADESLSGYVNSFGVRFAGLFASMHWLKMIAEMIACDSIHHYGVGFIIRGLLANILPENYLNRLRYMRNHGENKAAWMSIDAINNMHTGVKRLSLRDLSYYELMDGHLQQLLHYADRDSMAHSVESRLPFLDYKLVEFIFGLPDEYKLSRGITKRVLRESMKGILTEKVRTRMTKLGFVTPEEVWMRENSKFFTAKLKEMIECSDGIINDNVLVLWNEIINKRRAFDFSIWRIISFGTWMHRFDVKA